MPHPEQAYCQFASYSYFGNRVIAANRQARILAMPLFVAARYRQRCLP
jgi:hypothetical protein